MCACTAACAPSVARPAPGTCRSFCCTPRRPGRAAVVMHSGKSREEQDGSAKIAKDANIANKSRYWRPLRTKRFAVGMNHDRGTCEIFSDQVSQRFRKIGKTSSREKVSQ